ncbi:hypothetical protein MATL_G00243350 [Megalops atlanticus]|uniref:Uncharacterized protein n=1 Tax=Megalops atlanticus TaxID=7932 RepID=A0A9D3PCV1_MEGAT|nr:hypothetical protein MATL_G00243350 [Megalops atlanticus]
MRDCAIVRLPKFFTQGKAVFITGCDSGFGFALAKYLHKLGFTVFAGCLLKESGGDGAAALEGLHSDRMKVVQLDVCSEEQVTRAAEFVRENLEDPERGLWALVNNAGVSAFGEVEFTSMETYKRVSEVNLWGTVRVTKALLPLVRRAEGRVVNMAGMFGRMGHGQRSADCVSQHAVEGFSDCLRHEMKPWRVAVIVVEPGNFSAAAGILTRDAVAAAADRLWAEAPAGVQEDYGKAHFERRVASVRAHCGGGERDVAPVISAVADAVRSRHPFTRYNPMETHWWIRMQVMTHLPAAVSDWLYF